MLRNDPNIRRPIMLRKLNLACLIAMTTACFVTSCNDNPEKRSGKSTEETEQSTTEPRKYRLLVSPCGKPSMMFSKFTKLSDYLSENTGLKVELLVARDFEEFLSKVENHEADFCYLDPAIYLDLRDFFDKTFLYAALCGFIDDYENKPQETGCIVARADSNIRTIADVKGKRVIFGPKGSATKWIAAKQALKNNGIDLERDLAGYSFGGGCMDIILDILHHKADVGCIRTLMCPICQHSIYYEHSTLDTSKLSHVAVTPPVGTWVFTCAVHTDVKAVGKIVDALPEASGVQENEVFPREIRSGFIKVDNSHFNDIRTMQNQQ
jgi:phosphonate transport system substrate-binding protein